MSDATPSAAAVRQEQRARRLLEAKLTQLAAEAGSLAVEAPEPGSQVQYGKRAGDHVAEVADRAARSRTAGELEKLGAEVRAAVGKLDAGTYGCCDDCGQSIPAARLEVLPWATRCVGCQAQPRR